MDDIILAGVVWMLATLTLTTGVGAGVVYSPMFVIFFDLDLESAVATSILIQLAGVGTTAVGHLADPATDRALAVRLGAWGVVGVGAAWAVGGLIPVAVAEVLFVIAMTTIGVWLSMGTRSPRLVERLIPAASMIDRRATAEGVEYEFCRPRQGYVFAGLAGAATSVLGVSGAEIHITALMARCGVPTQIAIGTGTVAAGLGLAGAAVVATISGGVAPAILVVAAPAAVVGSWTARHVAHRFSAAILRPLLSLLVIASAIGVAFREILA